MDEDGEDENSDDDMIPDTQPPKLPQLQSQVYDVNAQMMISNTFFGTGEARMILWFPKMRITTLQRLILNAQTTHGPKSIISLSTHAPSHPLSDSWPRHSSSASDFTAPMIP